MPILYALLDDGSLRLWKHFDDDENLKLVTAWKGLSDLLKSSFRSKLKFCNNEVSHVL